MITVLWLILIGARSIKFYVQPIDKKCKYHTRCINSLPTSFLFLARVNHSESTGHYTANLTISPSPTPWIKQCMIHLLGICISYFYLLYDNIIRSSITLSFYFLFYLLWTHFLTLRARSLVGVCAKDNQSMYLLHTDVPLPLFLPSFPSL